MGVNCEFHLHFFRYTLLWAIDLQTFRFWSNFLQIGSEKIPHTSFFVNLNKVSDSAPLQYQFELMGLLEVTQKLIHSMINSVLHFHPYLFILPVRENFQNLYKKCAEKRSIFKKFSAKTLHNNALICAEKC